MTSGHRGQWFTSNDNARIGRITPTGEITEIPLPADSYPAQGDITVGADGVVWFIAGNAVARLRP